MDGKTIYLSNFCVDSWKEQILQEFCLSIQISRSTIDNDHDERVGTCKRIGLSSGI